MVTVPSDEPERLAALRELAILDTEPEQLYDDVVAPAAAICDAPVAIVGLASTEPPRDVSFCSRAILDPDALFVVPGAPA
jgi:hypothetical protein